MDDLSSPFGSNAPDAPVFRATSNTRTYLIIGAVGVVALITSGHLHLLTLIIIVILFASVILHEISHGVAAYLFGDDTAKRAGRLTLNPLPHIDPLGTIFLPLIMAFSFGAGFGYARPVPVNLSKLRSPRNHGVFVALAGPAMNLLLVGLAWLLWQLVDPSYYIDPGSNFAGAVIYYLGLINLWLALFNLLPIPPLDGSVLIERSLPRKYWPGYLQFRQYAIFIPLAIVLVDLTLKLGIFVTLQNWIETLWDNMLVG